MIIKRRKNEEKLFSEFLCEKNFAIIDSKDNLLNFEVLSRAPLEIMKSLEMYKYLGGKWVYHWAIVKIVNNLAIYAINSGISPQTLLIGCEDNRNLVSRVLGSNREKKITESFGLPDDFINLVRDKMLTETKNNSNTSSSEPAYNSWFKSKSCSISNNDFKMYIKYIALSLSGQIDPNSHYSIWDRDVQSDIKKLSIDYNYINRNLDSVSRIIARCIFNIRGELTEVCTRFNNLITL